jgi:UDP-glucose 4-epimerase
MPFAEAAEHDRPTVAVLGARGFVGRAIVAALRAREIPTVLRNSDTPAVRQGQLDPAVARATSVIVVTGRSNPALAERDGDTAARELAESRELFHLLGRSRSRLPATQRILLASSGGAVYDTRQEPPYHEWSDTAPSSAYAQLKLDIEGAFLSTTAHDSERTVLRLSNVYGPGQRTGTGQGVVGHWFEALRNDESIRLFGDPDTIRDYVYIDDVAQAFVAAHLTGGALPAVLNIGSGRPTSLRELLTLVLQSADRVDQPVEFTSDRPFDRRHTWLDISAARRALGWQPTTSLEAGLRRAWEHLSTSATVDPVAPGRLS